MATDPNRVLNPAEIADLTGSYAKMTSDAALQMVRIQEAKTKAKIVGSVADKSRLDAMVDDIRTNHDSLFKVVKEIETSNTIGGNPVTAEKASKLYKVMGGLASRYKELADFAASMTTDEYVKRIVTGTGHTLAGVAARFYKAGDAILEIVENVTTKTKDTVKKAKWVGPAVVGSAIAFGLYKVVSTRR